MGCCGWDEVEKVPTVPTTPAPADPRHLVALHRARAEVDLQEVAAGRSLCRVSGPDLALVKRAEGRLAALAELERTMRTTGVDASVAAEGLLGRWSTRCRDADGRGVAWEAYLEGGVVELEAVGRALDAMRGDEIRTGSGGDPARTDSASRGRQGP